MTNVGTYWYVLYSRYIFEIGLRLLKLLKITQVIKDYYG